MVRSLIPDDGYNADQYPQGTAGLLLEQCVCMVDMEAVFCGKPVFFSSGPWKTAGKSRFAVTGSYLSVP